jgi:hydroxymethylbilane synthase
MSAELRRIVLASRASQLAQIQTNIVLDALKSAFPDRAFGTSFMSTQGDKNQSQALYLLGGKSLWTKELEVALLEGEVDLLVHSLKDVPTTLPEGCALGAILEREHGEDCLVVKRGYTVVDGKTVHTLDDLPTGAVIGTSSVRRVAQLKRKYPGLVFKDVVRANFTPSFFLNQHNVLKRGNLCVQSHTPTPVTRLGTNPQEKQNELYKATRAWQN